MYKASQMEVKNPKDTIGLAYVSLRFLMKGVEEAF